MPAKEPIREGSGRDACSASDAQAGKVLFENLGDHPHVRQVGYAQELLVRRGDRGLGLCLDVAELLLRRVDPLCVPPIGARTASSEVTCDAFRSELTRSGDIP